VAEAFTKLKDSGKVRFLSWQFPPDACQQFKVRPMPIITTKEISLGKLDAFEDGTLVVPH
jgi:predicted oxidoreductase